MTTLAELGSLLDELGRRPSCEGDGLTELDHLLQCAAELAEVRPDDVELQLAGLVHDVGHALGSDADHGHLGAAFVRPVLGPRVAQLVDAHVMAKRYLVAVEPAYAAGLSPDSSRTLRLQGGPMSPAEAEAFRGRPDAADAVLLRRADDRAKVPGRRVRGLEHWRGALARGAPPARSGGAAAESVVRRDRPRGA